MLKDKLDKVLFAVLVVSSIVVVAILVVVFLPAGPLPDGEEDRIECPGGDTKEACHELHCAWSPAAKAPSCFMTKKAFGYVIDGAKKTTSNGFSVDLRRKSNYSMYGSGIRNVRFELVYVTEYIVRFKLVDAENSRYEVPVQKEFPLLTNPLKVDSKALKYEVELDSEKKNSDFGIKVKRKSNGTILWDTSIGGLTLSDQYLQMASYLPSKNIYGIGENPHPSFRHNLNYKTWPLFSRDQFPTDGNKHLYGVHPFYTCLEKEGKSHGVLFLNSNAMEVTLMPYPAISFRTIGGILDFFIIVGDNPEHVVQLYTSMIGRPMLPPYWSLGFQLSRYGYNNLDNVKAVVERTRKAAIAQDVQIVDIDHMQSNRDFTWDQKNFKGLDEYINKTKQEYGLRWIIILDPAIEAVTEGYEVYTTGAKDEVFVKRSPEMNSTLFPDSIVDTANATFGKVWPTGPAAFPDFFLSKTKDWWIAQIKEHQKKINFDGLWIDMNEPSNFGTNEEYPDYCPKQDKKCWSLKCPKSALDDPPYDILSSYTGKRLSQQTICMASVQGEEGNYYSHYDVHSIYGWSQTEPTLRAAQESIGQRSLLISRSTYVSSGRHTGHWLGDNRSRWVDLHRSIIGMLEFNLFGIPYIGADVCGFFGDTTPEMCKRWMQLGAFYPFFRNHNGMNQKDQDPVSLGDDVTKTSKAAVERRYQLRPYLYTLFYRANVDGSTVIRPLFHEYPTDPNTWDIDTQFLWGKGLLVSPILNEGQKNIKIYLPKGEWYVFNEEKSEANKSKGEFLDVVDTGENIPLHIQAGLILPTEDYELGKSERKTTNITLYVFPNEGTASGELFWDDGLSIDTIKDKKYTMMKFSYSRCRLTITAEQAFQYLSPTLMLKQVIIFQALDAAKAYVDGKPQDIKVDKTRDVLTIPVSKTVESVSEINWEDSGKKCKTQKSSQMS